VLDAAGRLQGASGRVQDQASAPACGIRQSCQEVVEVCGEAESLGGERDRRGTAPWPDQGWPGGGASTQETGNAVGSAPAKKHVARPWARALSHLAAPANEQIRRCSLVCSQIFLLLPWLRSNTSSAGAQSSEPQTAASHAGRRRRSPGSWPRRSRTRRGSCGCQRKRAILMAKADR